MARTGQAVLAVALLLGGCSTRQEVAGVRAHAGHSPLNADAPVAIHVESIVGPVPDPEGWYRGRVGVTWVADGRVSRPYALEAIESRARELGANDVLIFEPAKDLAGPSKLTRDVHVRFQYRSAN